MDFLGGIGKCEVEVPEFCHRTRELCQEVLKCSDFVAQLKARKNKVTAAFRALRLEQKNWQLTKDSLSARVTNYEWWNAKLESALQVMGDKNVGLIMSWAILGLRLKG